MNTTSDAAIRDAANVSNENPHAIFLHFDEVDGAGHSYVSIKTLLNILIPLKTQMVRL